MQTFTANEAKTRFGEFIDLAQREPLRVMRRDRVVGVMVSAQDYEAMRACGCRCRKIFRCRPSVATVTTMRSFTQHG